MIRKVKNKIIASVLLALWACSSVRADEVKMILYDNFLKNIEEQNKTVDTNPETEVADTTEVLDNYLYSKKLKSNISQKLIQENSLVELEQLEEYKLASLLPILEYEPISNRSNDMDYYEYRNIKDEWWKNYRASASYKALEKACISYYSSYKKNFIKRYKAWNKFFLANKLDYSDEIQNKKIYASMRILFNKDNYDYKRNNYEYWNSDILEYLTRDDLNYSYEAQWRAILLSQKVDFNVLTDKDIDNIKALMSQWKIKENDLAVIRRLVARPDFDLAEFAGFYHLYYGYSSPHELIEIYYDYLKELKPQKSYDKEDLKLYGAIREEKALTIDQKKAIMDYNVYYYNISNEEKAEIVHKVSSNPRIADEDKYEKIIKKFDRKVRKTKILCGIGSVFGILFLVATAPIWGIPVLILMWAFTSAPHY